MTRKSLTMQQTDYVRLGGQGCGGGGDDGGSQGNPLGERVDGLLELWVFLDEDLELGDSVDDGRYPRGNGQGSGTR